VSETWSAVSAYLLITNSIPFIVAPLGISEEVNPKFVRTRSYPLLLGEVQLAYEVSSAFT